MHMATNEEVMILLFKW